MKRRSILLGLGTVAAALVTQGVTPGVLHGGLFRRRRRVNCAPQSGQHRPELAVPVSAVIWISYPANGDDLVLPGDTLTATGGVPASSGAVTVSAIVYPGHLSDSEISKDPDKNALGAVIISNSWECPDTLIPGIGFSPLPFTCVAWRRAENTTSVCYHFTKRHFTARQEMAMARA